MFEGLGVRICSLVLAFAAAVALVASCSPAVVSPDGWWDPGVHAVDGYWVTEERPCVVGVEWGCEFMRDTALAVIQEREPGAIVDRIVTAGWPSMREANQQAFTFAGLTTPRFVIVDLADGSRRVVGLMCGALSHDGGFQRLGCIPDDLSMFRVGNGWMSDR
jgi:hypothetical protein